jgi:NAD+ diphosphatase
MVARRCGACGQFEYIKAQPVALVAIWRRAPSGGAEVLLARHTYGATQYWALVGGYLDAAESLEDAAIREAAEEVGLGLTDVRYYGTARVRHAGPSVMRWSSWPAP